MKFPNATTTSQNYNTKPYPRREPASRIISVDTDEIIRNSQLGIVSTGASLMVAVDAARYGSTSTEMEPSPIETEPSPSSRTDIWNRPLPSSDFRGYAIDGEEDEGGADNIESVYLSEDGYNFDGVDSDVDPDLSEDEEDEILISMIDFIGNKPQIQSDLVHTDDIPLTEFKNSETLVPKLETNLNRKFKMSTWEKIIFTSADPKL